MFYLKKQKPLEITQNTKDLLVIEKPKNLRLLHTNLVIYIIVGVVLLYYAIVYHKSIQSMSVFLLLVCAVPIIYLFISVSGLITEIIGYKIVFNKQNDQLCLNSKTYNIKNIEKVALLKRGEKDNFREWIKFKLLVETTDNKIIILAISKKTEVLAKLANAISAFLKIDLTTDIEPAELDHFSKSRTY